jgi:hypothetical protein
MAVFGVIDTAASGDTFYDAEVKNAENWAIMEAMSTTVSHNYAAAAADWTLSTTESYANYLVATNASGAVNAYITTPVPGHTYLIYNNTGYVLTFKVTGQTGGTIANGKRAFYVTGSADVYEIWEQP